MDYRKSIYPCCNCNKIFVEYQLTSSFKVRDVLSDEMICIQVQDAIAYIYGTSVEEIQCYLNNTKQTSYLAQDIFVNAVKICSLCVHLLSQIYYSLLKFENLTNPISVVGKIQKRDRNFQNAEILNGAISRQGDEDSIRFPKEEVDDVCDNLNLVSNETEEYDHLNLRSNDNLSEEDFKYDTGSNEPNQKNSETPKDATSLPVTDAKEKILKIKKTSTDKDSNCSNGKTQKKSNKIRGTSKPSIKIFKIKTKKKVQKTKKESNKTKDDDSLNLRQKEKRYKCKICGKGASSWQSLQHHHMPSHFQNTTCLICQKTLSSVAGLKFHLKFTHKQGTDLSGECDICGKVMLYRNMDKHMETHGPRDEYQCDKCGKVYLDKRGLDEHFLTHTEDFVPLLCRYCGKTFERRIVLRAHEKGHTAVKKFTCAICPAKFQRNCDLQQHIRAHTTKERFKCDLCAKDFKHRKNLMGHLKLHKEEEEKGEYIAKCDHCGKLLKNRRRLKLHVDNIHLNRKVYECSICGKGLSSSQTLANHKKTHK